MIGVSFDTVERQRAFAEKHGYTFPLLADTERRIGMAYRACRTPKDLFAARYTYVIGPDGRIVEAIDTKSPGGQAADLLTRLK